MHPHRRRLGVHLPLGAGMIKAAEHAREIGATAIQIFADNPTAWRRRSEPPKEQRAFRECLEVYDIAPVAIHASYLVNLAGPDADFFERSVALLAEELRVAPGFGARFVNVHTGSHRDSGVETGIRRVADGVARSLALVDPRPDEPMLVLENSAGGGFGVGTTLEELADIAAAIDTIGVPARRVGFCLDTAHLWAAGYQISDPHKIDDLLERFDSLIGLDRLVMIHLNDSKAPLGAHLDRHEHVGAGSIGEEGMAHLLRHERLWNVPVYLETPGMDEGYDAINIARVLALIEGRSLAPLPPGAMTVRGSRARTAPAAEHEHV